MFGWIHESLRQLVNRKYGKDVWTKILEAAMFVEGTENDISKYYKDEDTFRILAAMVNVIGIPVDEIWEAYGGFLIQYTMETGWDELLRAMSPDLQGFLDGLDSLHYFIDRMVYSTKLRGPAFRCESSGLEDGSLLLHYYSTRTGLYPIVKGVVREASRRIYDTEVVIKVKDRIKEKDGSAVKEHVIFLITQVENTSGHFRVLDVVSKKPTAVLEGEVDDPITKAVGGAPYTLSLEDFCNAFPHHFCFDKELRIQHLGAHMQTAYPWILPHKTLLSDVLDLCHPDIVMKFEQINAFKNSLFIFRLKEAIATQKRGDDASTLKNEITLKGSMQLVGNGEYMCYMCSLNVTTLRELMDRNLYVSDIQRHDSTRDLIMLNQSRMSQVELNKRLEETTRNLRKMASELEAEKQRTEELLCELMPISVAESLRQGHAVEASEFNEATILFTDIVTFTNICAMCTPYDVVNLLNDLYLRFDRLIGLHDVYKVETIGDAYMVAGGVPKESVNHAESVLNASIGMLMESKSVLSPINKLPICIRIGVHSGPVVAGVVGIKMPRYCLFGDTIYLANKMESNGVPGRIHVSEPAKKSALRTNPSFVFEDRGNTEIKGTGIMYTYFLEKNEKLSVWEICKREIDGHHTADGYFELHGSSALKSIDNGVGKMSSRESTSNKISASVEDLNRTPTTRNSRTCTIL